MILESSSGEVLKPETINYRTYKPERDGLFVKESLDRLRIGNATVENIKEYVTKVLFVTDVV